MGCPSGISSGLWWADPALQAAADAVTETRSAFLNTLSGSSPLSGSITALGPASPTTRLHVAEVSTSNWRWPHRSTRSCLRERVTAPVDLAQARAAVGYWLSPTARGRGVASHALWLLAHWAFNVIGLARLELTCGPDNHASQLVAERSGFVREGCCARTSPSRADGATASCSVCSPTNCGYRKPGSSGAGTDMWVPECCTCR